MVHGCAAGTPLARQVLAPLTSSSCRVGDPLCQGSSRAQAEIRNRTEKCGGQTRQEFAFSICREPVGLDTPRQTVSRGWGHRETLPGFFLPIPEVEDPMTWVAPTTWHRGLVAVAAGWLGRAGL